MQHPELDFHPDQYVPPKTAEKIIGCSAAHLGNLRFFGRGPAYSKVGTAIRYRIGDLHDYMKRTRVEPKEV